MAQKTKSNKYLERFALYPTLIETPPEENLNIIIVLPCHNEPFLLMTLDALWSCQRPTKSVEVIVVINASERSSSEVHQQNERSLKEIEQWKNTHIEASFQVHVLYFPDLPKKRAGVGLARKIGMDEATRRFHTINNEQGIIANIDADCSCDSNYLVELEKHFKHHPKTTGCVIHYEHPLEGDEPPEIYEAIIQYELFLRYYVHAVRFSGFPHTYQTVGSSFAVRSHTYQKVGGMNQKQAGEDFYFLQKVFQTERCSELFTTKIIPSSRISDRVPFGTGKAVSDIINHTQSTYQTYHPSSFKVLRLFLKQIDNFYHLTIENISEIIKEFPISLSDFLTEIDFLKQLERARSETKTLKSFRKRFFQWFNAFMVLRWVHFARDHHYPNISIEEGVLWLFDEWNLSYNQNSTPKELLEIFRKIDKQAIEK